MPFVTYIMQILHINRMAVLELNWLEDLIALVEAENISQAAERRNITQPAFSRRIKKIEDWLGIDIVERSHRPVRVKTAIKRKIEDNRTVISQLQQIKSDIQAWDDTRHNISIGAQHSISISHMPSFIKRLKSERPEISITLESANRDICYSQLMTRQVAIIAIYETSKIPIAEDQSLLEKITLGHDVLCPVGTPDFQNRLNDIFERKNSLPLIAFPRHVFLGEVFFSEILSDLQSTVQLNTICETALVPAALELVLRGIGIAWLPRFYCEEQIKSGVLKDYSDKFRKTPIKVVAARTTNSQPKVVDLVWKTLKNFSVE